MLPVVVSEPRNHIDEFSELRGKGSHACLYWQLLSSRRSAAPALHGLMALALSWAEPTTNLHSGIEAGLLRAFQLCPIVIRHQLVLHNCSAALPALSLLRCAGGLAVSYGGMFTGLLDSA